MSKTIYKSIDGTNTDLVLVKTNPNYYRHPFNKTTCEDCYYNKSDKCPDYKNGYNIAPCIRMLFGKRTDFHFIKAFE